jgi:hypothetical protein
LRSQVPLERPRPVCRIEPPEHDQRHIVSVSRRPVTSQPVQRRRIIVHGTIVAWPQPPA